MRATVCLVQFGLRVVGPCGVAAQARAVVRRDDGPEGGVGGPLGMAELLDVGAAALKACQC
jgi:hypothetical protein